MKKVLILCAVCSVITAVAVAFGVIKNNARSVEQPPSESKAVKADNESIIRLLRDARVTAFSSWSVQDGESKKLTYTVQAFDQDPNDGEPGVKLSIFDEAGKVIYEDYFSEVERIYSSYALRNDSPQLIVEADYGGSMSFLKMLDYRNGKVVDLMEAVKPNNSFTVNAEVRPQLRTGVSPAKEPFQVLLTEGVGLASPADKNTHVFRYRDGAYRYVGKYPARKVDDYIEKLVTEHSSDKVKP